MMKIQFECPHCGEFEEIEVKEGVSEWKCKCGQMVPLRLSQTAPGRPGEEIRTYTPRLKCRNCNHRIFLDPAKPPNYKPSICPICHGEMILRFLCPTCKRKLDSTPDRYGESSACPGCGARISGGMEVVEYKVPVADDGIASGVRPAVSDQASVHEPKKNEPKTEEHKALAKAFPAVTKPESVEHDSSLSHIKDKQTIPAQASRGKNTTEQQVESSTRPQSKAMPGAAAPAAKKPAVPQTDFGEDFEDGEHINRICIVCRSPLPTRANFCPFCGKSQTQTQSPLKEEVEQLSVDTRISTFLLPAIGLIMLTAAVLFVLSIYKSDARGTLFSAVAILCGLAALVTCMGASQLSISLLSAKIPPNSKLNDKLRTSANDTYIFSLLFSILSLACVASGLLEVANTIKTQATPPTLMRQDPELSQPRKLLSIPSSVQQASESQEGER